MAQEQFFDEVIEGEIPVSIYLASGVRLKGIIFSHDDYTVGLLYQGQQQLIYKRQISTVLPERSFNQKGHKKKGLE